MIAVLNGAGGPVVLEHVNPDVDAFGATLALVRVMPGGRAAFTLGARPVGPRLSGMLDWAGRGPCDARRVAEADVAVVVDTANVQRVNVEGGWDAIAGKYVVNIDHHVSNERFGRLNWIVDTASSTCEMVYRLIAAAGWPLDGPTATLLYAGIHADTCGFSLPTPAETFEVVADLVRAGADPAAVGERLWRTQRPEEFELLRTVYRNTRVTAEGRIAYSTLTLAEIAATGCTPAHIEDQVDVPRSLAGARVAILLSEIEPGLVRVNLRGRQDTEVLPIAAALGGGGHRFSAGVRVRATMEAALDRVTTQAILHLF
ncbi:MAG TPA: DHH family phosphoesterase [Phycisphaerae bacterium]|nr:DHH family phosphoesterase [Phycisphaerae bacterium]